MLKRTFLLFVFMLTFLSVYSQFNLGIKIGINQDVQKFSQEINASTESQQDDSVLGNIYTYHFGLSGDYNLNSKFGIATELLYSVKGAHYNISEFTKGHDHKLSYLTMPVLVKYEVLMNLDVQGGIEMGYLFKTQDNISSSNGVLDDIANFNRFDFSGILGLKLYLPANVNLSIRYIHGLSSVMDLESRNLEGEEIHDVKIMNRTYQLSIGYNIL